MSISGCFKPKMMTKSKIKGLKTKKQTVKNSVRPYLGKT